MGMHGALNAGGVVVFLSAGRCGTQWLAATLREIYPTRLEVEHEPIGPLYRPRLFFRRWDDPESLLAVPEIRRHIDRVVAKHHYVETGWPLFAALPLLAQRLGPRLRVVHLTRHPVPSAVSHLAHNSYAGSARDDPYTELATLAPHDPNVFQPEYAERWRQLSAYEKCLYWWTEVNLFALEVAERLPETQMLRVASEQMLAGDRATLERLVEFIGVPWDERWADRPRRRIDRWHHRTDQHFDPLAIREHPRAIAVAERLGYRLSELDLCELEARYRGTPSPGGDRFGRYRAVSR